MNYDEALKHIMRGGRLEYEYCGAKRYIVAELQQSGDPRIIRRSNCSEYLTRDWFEELCGKREMRPSTPDPMPTTRMLEFAKMNEGVVYYDRNSRVSATYHSDADGGYWRAWKALCGRVCPLPDSDAWETMP